jgi:hypothetical protein
MDILSNLHITTIQIILYACIGIALLLAVVGLIVWLRMRDLKRLYRRKMVFIEVTPPLHAHKSPEATEQLFHQLYSAVATQPLWHKLLRRSIIFTPEIVSSRRDGIRYIISTNEDEADAIENRLGDFLSNVHIKRISDPLLPKNDFTQVKELRQKKHFAQSIRTYATFEEHDPIAYITGAMNKLAGDEQVALQLVLSPAKVRDMAGIVQRYREYYKVSDATHNKAYGQLYRADFRVRVVASNAEALRARMHGMESAITAFNIPKIQQLKARHSFPKKITEKQREWAFVHRMPSRIPKNSNIFSGLELANIYHFPADQTATESMVQSLSRTLSAPLSLHNDEDFSVVIGETNHHGEKFKIGLTREERSRHALYIGKTGSGKTTMLEYEILQDIKNGEGVVFIDPHGDSAESLLGKIPEDRIKDVVYFNPDDIDFPASINMLEMPEGVTGNELLRQKDLVTETLITVFRKLFSEGGDGGSRIEAMLRNTIHTALTLKDPTIFTLYKLINNPTFRKGVVARLENENLRDFWLNEVGEAGGMQRVKMMQGITTKLDRLIFSPSAARVLGHPKSTIDFSDILDSRKILICNLSKGRLGEDTSQVFGVIILAEIQIAALQRARQDVGDRAPVYIYVDEFQNFATPSFVELLAEARKYGINMNMAQQTLSQQRDENMINTTIGNSGTIVIFQTVSLDDEKFIGRLFNNFIEPREIQDLPAFNFYVRLSAVTSQKPVSGQTIVPTEKSDPDIAKRVIESSREHYARPYVLETPRKATGTLRIEKMTNDMSEPESNTGTPVISAEDL